MSCAVVFLMLAAALSALGACATLTPSGARETTIQAAQPETAPTDIRQTTSGLVRGVAENGSLHFRGTPYASPPVGELRWRPPRPPQSWDGVRDASRYGPICVQKYGVPGMIQSEDCLTLNVSIPESARPQDKLPVLVRVHGGGLVEGSGAAAHAAAVWNKHGVILVTMNYRLGPLGFFDHSALREGKGPHPANFGLLDVKAALEWVQANIAAFGGDPDQVTLSGVSAGGEMVQLLQVMPGTEHLFARALSSSGYAAWPIPMSRALSHGLLPADRDAGAIAAAIAVKASGRTGTLNARQLRALPPEALARAHDGFVRPIIDGVTVLDDPVKLFTAGKAHTAPVLTGASSYEGSVFPYSGLSEKDVLAMLGGRRDAVLALYADDFAISASQGISRLFGDMRYVLSSALVAGETSKRMPSFLYYVDYAPLAQGVRLPGAPHGGETPMLEVGDPATPGALMQAYWLNFIRTGDPNGEGLPVWPKADADHRQWMTFGNAVKVQDVMRDKLTLLRDALGLTRGEAN